MFPLDTPYNPLDFTRWEQVMSLLIIVAGGIVWRYLGTMKAAQKETGATVKEIKQTLTETNGGGSVKDALNRVEAEQLATAKKLDDHITWSEGYVKDTADRIDGIDHPGKHYIEETNEGE